MTNKRNHYSFEFYIILWMVFFFILFPNKTKINITKINNPVKYEKYVKETLRVEKKILQKFNCLIAQKLKLTKHRTNHLMEINSLNNNNLNLAYDEGTHVSKNTWGINNVCRPADAGKDGQRLPYFRILYFSNYYKNQERFYDRIFDFLINGLKLDPQRLFIISVKKAEKYKRVFKRYKISLLLRDSGIAKQRREGSGYYYQPVEQNGEWTLSIHYMLSVVSLEGDVEQLLHNPSQIELFEGAVEIIPKLSGGGFGLERLIAIYRLQSLNSNPYNNRIFKTIDYRHSLKELLKRILVEFKHRGNLSLINCNNFKVIKKIANKYNKIKDNSNQPDQMKIKYLNKKCMYFENKIKNQE